MSINQDATEAISVKGVSKEYTFTHARRWSPLGHWRSRNKSSQDSKSAGYLALDDINFSVGKGETVGVLGKNGAGKSTLLQVITGVLQPTKGSVNIAGRIGALLELGAGFNPELTGRENIELAGAVLGLSSDEVRRKLDEIIEFADIGEFIDHPVKTYSSGMMVRVAFSQQVHMDPDVLIIDEALSVGDMFFQQKCLAKIKDIIGRGVTVFFVSHSLNAVKSLCRRAILLEKGKLVADGPSEEVCEQYQNSMSSTSPEDLAAAIAQSEMNRSEHGELRLHFEESFPVLPEDVFESTVLNRSGGGEIRFTGFAVLDSSGNRVTSIERANNIKLRLQFKVNSEVPAGATIGILIRDMHGVDLLAYNTDFYEAYLPAMAAGDRVYSLDVSTSLPFAMGRYSFHCGAKPSADSPYFYDRCFNIGVLDIESNPLTWGMYGGRLVHTPNDLKLLVNAV
ncbi:ABC transporter ATP-binding protein [Luteimonas sp. FXH3W]|uniref:ABC transporter ATP-binding protein n=1 Tax=Aquilutibacter rugosus TaxID=3115820 RepID=A0ABU7UZN4_9GAMM